jgi:hypothetical protein
MASSPDDNALRLPPSGEANVGYLIANFDVNEFLPKTLRSHPKRSLNQPFRYPDGPTTNQCFSEMLPGKDFSGSHHVGLRLD